MIRGTEPSGCPTPERRRNASRYGLFAATANLVSDTSGDRRADLISDTSAPHRTRRGHRSLSVAIPWRATVAALATRMLDPRPASLSTEAHRNSLVSSVVTSEPAGTCAPPPSKSGAKTQTGVAVGSGQRVAWTTSPTARNARPKVLISCVDYFTREDWQVRSKGGHSSIPSKKNRFVLLQEKKRGKTNLNLRISICLLRFILLLLG
jgi:hypothetical protein